MLNVHGNFILHNHKISTENEICSKESGDWHLYFATLFSKDIIIWQNTSFCNLFVIYLIVKTDIGVFRCCVDINNGQTIKNISMIYFIQWFPTLAIALIQKLCPA